MAAPTYSTDLTLIDDAENVANYVATGGGSSALNDETDYFLEGTQCISKNGFTATTKGQMYDNTTAVSVTAGDAVFIWGRQANRNLLDTIAAGGGQVIMGTANNAFEQFYVDGNDVAGSDLLSWVSYAVDPTATSSATTGSPGASSTWDHFGMQWKTLGSGSLKGAPNAIDVIRHGRELRAVDGDMANGYATFTGMAGHDSDTTRRYGILTEGTGSLLFHGALVLGQSGTSVDFRDENVSISVLDDPFVPSTFNEIEIQNASSNVEWTTVQISHLADSPTSSTTLTLDVGTFTGDSCRFAGCATTTFNSNGSSSCIDTTWADSGQIVLNEADISGSSILTSTVAADEGAVYDNRTTSGATSITELDNTTFSQGTNAHHAIRFGTNVTHDITLTGIEFTGFDSTDDVNGSTLRFDATTGSINVNLVDCTVDGAAASSSNVGVDDAAGITVTLVVNPVTVKVTAVEDDGDPIQSAQVILRASDDTGPFPYDEQVTITRSGSTASVSHTAHGMANNDKVQITGTESEEYRGVFSITNVTTNAYDYTVSGTPTTPAVARVTNLADYSEEIDNAYWGKNGGTITANATTAPDGTTTADEFVEDTSTGNHRVLKTINTTLNETYVWSGYLKPNGIRYCRVRQQFASGEDIIAFLDVQDGVITSTQESGTAVITDLGLRDEGNGWYRFFIIGENTQDTNTGFLIEMLDVQDGSTSYTGDGSSGMYVWGLQAAAGDALTKYYESVGTTNGTSIRSTFVALSGTTDVNGEVQASRVYSGNQPVEGWSRKSTSAPYYQQATINDTISSSAGLDVTGVMVSDE